MKKLLTAVLLATSLTILGCAGGQADKEVNITPQMTTGTITFTFPSGSADVVARSLQEGKPLVSISQTMTLSDSALEGGDQDAKGGTAAPKGEVTVPLSVDAPSAPTLPVPPSNPDKPVIVDPPVVVDPPVTVDPPVVSAEKGNYHRKTNGERPTWYFSKKMTDYPNVFLMDILGCDILKVEKTSGQTRWQHNGYLIKQSDVPGRGLALLAPSSCISKTAYLKGVK